MFDTTVSIYRPEGTLLVGTDGRNCSGIRVQVDRAGDKEVIEKRNTTGFQGYYAFKIYTFDWLYNSLLQIEDVLFDERITDPDTGQLYKYRVVDRPKNYLYDHQEVFCDVIVGH